MEGKATHCPRGLTLTRQLKLNGLTFQPASEDGNNAASERPRFAQSRCQGKERVPTFFSSPFDCLLGLLVITMGNSDYLRECKRPEWTIVSERLFHARMH